MTFGSRLKLYRTRAKLSQLALGKLMGWDDAQSRISQYEGNKREPTLKEIERFAQILGIQAHTLAFGDIIVAVKHTQTPPRPPARRSKKGAPKYQKGQKLAKLTAT